MAHELSPPSYDVVVGAEKRRNDNTFDLRSFSDPFGAKHPPHYTRSQSTPERSRQPTTLERSRPSRNRRLRDVTIEEDEVFEEPYGASLRQDYRSHHPERAQSLRQDVRPKLNDRRRGERPRKSYEDLRQPDDLQRSSEDLRRADERLRKSFEDLRRARLSHEDLSQLGLSSPTRNRIYSAGYESLKSTSGNNRSSSPRKTSSGDSEYSFENASNGNRVRSPTGGAFYSPSRSPVKSSSGDSGESTLKSSSGDSRYSLGSGSNGNGSTSRSSPGDSRHSRGSNSPSNGSTPTKSLNSDPRFSKGYGSNPAAPFHPYLSDTWQNQTGHPSSLDMDASDPQPEAYSSYASTLEKDTKLNQRSVNNNNSDYDDYHYGACGTSGSLEKTYQKPKIRDKPVNFVKPSIPVKPQPHMPDMASGGTTSPSILKGAYRIDNMPSTPIKGATADFVFDYDPLKTALQQQIPMDSDPLKVYTQYQPDSAKPRDGVIFDPAKLQMQFSDNGSDAGQSGTLRSNATNASNATNTTNKSLDHYRQDYRSLATMRSRAETQSVTSSDDSVLKENSENALERVERIAERNRKAALLRSRIKRLGCGFVQVFVGLLLITNAVFIFLNKLTGWFTCAGFWAGTFAAVGGSLGILTHFNQKDLYVNIMIGVTMFNICVIYLGTFCVGLSFGLVQMENGGVLVFLDALNFIYISLSLFGIVASVIQMSPIEKYKEKKDLEIAKCFVDWKAIETKAPVIDRLPSTSSSHGSHGSHGSSGSHDQDGYRNYGYESSNYGDAITTV